MTTKEHKNETQHAEPETKAKTGKAAPTPVIGEPLWYWPQGKSNAEPDRQPCHAIVTHIDTAADHPAVNIAWLDMHGSNYNASAVPLLGGSDTWEEGVPFAQWPE